MKTLLHLLSASLLGLAACGVHGSTGERASSCSGKDACVATCPAGEVCSPAAERGLAFVGPGLIDDRPQLGHSDYLGKTFAQSISQPPVLPWAAGGVQTVRVDHVDGANYQSPIQFAFEIDVGGPFHVLDKAPPTARLKADRAGQTLLRVLTPGQPELLDRLAIGAEAIARVELAAYSPVSSGQAGTALLAGTRGLVAAHLFDTAGRRLVDESAILVALAPNGSSTRAGAWDLFEVGPTTADPAYFQLNTGSGTTFAGSVQVVDRIDRWIWLDQKRNQPLQPTLRELTVVTCVYPEAYGLDVATLDVVFSTEDPNLGLQTTVAGPNGPLTLPPGCVQAERNTDGVSVLKAEVGGFGDGITLRFDAP